MDVSNSRAWLGIAGLGLDGVNYLVGQYVPVVVEPQVDVAVLTVEVHLPLAHDPVDRAAVASVPVQDEDLADAVSHQRFHRVEHDRQPRARLHRQGADGVHVVLGDTHVDGHSQDDLRVQPLGGHLRNARAARDVLLEGQVFEVLLDAPRRYDGNVELARLTRVPKLAPRELLQSELVRKCHDSSSAKMLRRTVSRIHRAGGRGEGIRHPFSSIFLSSVSASSISSLSCPNSSALFRSALAFVSSPSDE